MPSTENFICLSYPTIEFLIPKKEVVAATFCERTNFIRDEKGSSKIIIDSKIIPFLDVDIPAKRINQEVQEKDIRTCIVITCKGIFKDSDNFAIVTSANCKVLELPLSDFSLFTESYSSKFVKNGIMACSFNENKTLRYLIDINKFFKKYQEILL